MKTTLKIICSVIIIAFVIIAINFHLNKKEAIAGCYVAHLAKDIYTLDITSQNGEEVKGALAFNNYEKDSSSGTFTGTYKNGILLGDYSFRSEGMDSISQVIFKKSGNDFIRGYGPMNSTGDKFTDLNTITFDQSQIFVRSSQICPV